MRSLDVVQLLSPSQVRVLILLDRTFLGSLVSYLEGRGLAADSFSHDDFGIVVFEDTKQTDKWRVICAR